MKKIGRTLIWLLSIACLVLAVLFSYRIIKMNILPTKLAIPIICAIIVFTLIVILCTLFFSRRLISKIISIVLIVALGIAYSYGTYYTMKTTTMIDSVTTLSNDTMYHASVVALKQNNYKLSDLEGKTIGITPKLDKKATDKSLKDIQKSITFNTQEFGTYYEEAKALYDGTVDAIIINESSRGLIYDSDEDTFANFNSYTQVIHETTWKEKKKAISDTADAVNVTEEPFTVMISGADSYGGLDDNGRSDSNMLLTVNPKTNRILMTSIPRDYYVPMVCSANAGNGCPDGQRDKLTHTGIYGVETTELTIEKFLGVDINYYIKVNFSSLVNIVDAIGGIDVTVGKGLAVKSFGADAALGGVEEGVNHLDGARALAFARERHAYEDGDRQRVKNQQIVLKAIFAKITSPKMATQYDDFMDALGDAFETNMSNSDLSKLIQYQLTFNPDWTFESYSLTGDTTTEFCPTLGDNASVMLEDKGGIETAKKKIKAIKNGKKASSVKDKKGTIQESEEEATANEDGVESQAVEGTPALPNNYYSSYDDQSTYSSNTYTQDTPVYTQSQTYQQDTSASYAQGTTSTESTY